MRDIDYTSEMNTFFSRNDYIGASNFLMEKAMAKDDNEITKEQRMAMLADARQLKRYGNKVQAIMAAAKPEDKEKLAFYFRRQSGHLSEEDKDSDYIRTIKAIGNKGKDEADYITYTFDDDDAYLKFRQSLGNNYNKTHDSKYRTSGFGIDNGKHTYTIYKQDLANGKVFDDVTNGLNKLTEWESVIVPGMVPQPIRNYERMRFSSTSYDEKGNVINKSKGFDDSQRQAYDYSQELNELYHKILKSGLVNNTAELTTFGYQNSIDKKLQLALMQGRLEPGMYEKLVKANNHSIVNRIMSMSLASANLDVYATESNGETHNLFEVASQDRVALTEEIQEAFKEGRVTISSGAAGGRTGTVLSIVRKKTSSDKEGKEKPYKTVFVPGLLDDDAKNLVESDNEAAAYVKRAECFSYGATYEMLNGTAFTQFQGDGSAVLMRNGNPQYASPEQVHQAMLENESLEFAIRELQTRSIVNDEPEEEIRKDINLYATRLYAYLNDGQTPETITTPGKKQEAEYIIQQYVNIMLAANGLK